MDNFNPPPPNPCLFAIMFEGGIGLLAVGIGWLLGDPPSARIHWTWEGAWMGIAATVPLVGVLWPCMRSNWKPLRELRETIDRNVLPLFARGRIAEFAVLSAVAGLGEEMLFRGVVQHSLARMLPGSTGMTVALLVASILFGLLHWLTPVYAAMAAAISVYLGAVWILTDNLLVPALAHALYDFWALVYLVRFAGHRSSDRPPRGDDRSVP